MASYLLRKTFINAIALRKVVGSSKLPVRSVISNYQFQPGPHPKTEAEYRAAAKKYGMPFEDYKPFPEDMGYGDYPMLPDIGADSKDITYPYDCPEMKRNFNEPVHATAEIFGEDRYDISMKPRYSVGVQWATFLGFMTGLFAVYFYLEDYKVGRPVTIKQYPSNGPHYYFNP